MNQAVVESLHGQLHSRRLALSNTIAQVGEATDLVQLLADVDRALERLGTDAFGQCVICGGQMDEQEMREFPLRQYCLCRLSPEQQDALQRDLDLAWQVQSSLLPNPNQSIDGWQVHFRYRPAGPVSGDYCDVVGHEGGDWLYFLVGDVSGKGVAASYLMAHLSALVRRTLDEPVPIASLMQTVNRHLLERTTDFHFVTLLAGRASRTGRAEFCNAGHCPPILIGDHPVRHLRSTAMPLGIAAESEYETITAELGTGDSLVLYTDGISEARNPVDSQYGPERLERIAHRNRRTTPARLAAACLDDLKLFQAGAPQTDDVTLMVVQRTGD